MKIEAWQRVAATEQRLEWTGDLNDDCSAHWAGLLLRAEWEQDVLWWWAVTDVATGEEIASSNRHVGAYHSGEAARHAAENAARDYLSVPPPD